MPHVLHCNSNHRQTSYTGHFEGIKPGLPKRTTETLHRYHNKTVAQSETVILIANPPDFRSAIAHKNHSSSQALGKHHDNIRER